VTVAFDVIIYDFSVSILFSQVITKVPSPVKVTETVGVLIRVRGAFDEIVNHSF